MVASSYVRYAEGRQKYTGGSPDPNTGTMTVAFTAPTARRFLFTAFIFSNFSGFPVTSAIPTGYTEIGTITCSPEIGARIAYKVAAGTETGVTWTWSGGSPASHSIFAWEYTGPGPVASAFNQAIGVTLAGGTPAAAYQGLPIVEMVLWYFAGDSGTDITRACDAMNTRFGSIFAGDTSPWVLQDATVSALPLPARTANGTFAGAQTRGFSILLSGPLVYSSPLVLERVHPWEASRI